MSKPTVERRLQRRFIALCADRDYQQRIAALVPDDWQVEWVTDFDDLGDWHEILLYRFIVMDLDEIDAFDPLDVIRALRMEYQINTPVFCFGGDQDIQDEMRLSRADRFFDREQMLEMLPEFVAQYNW